MTSPHSEFDEHWQGSEVSPAEVERALSRMLRKLTEPGDKSGEHPHARASVLNLIIKLAEDSSEALAVEALKDLADNHPSRTLVITADPSDAESGLDASATAHCHMRAGMRGRVCYEDARLTARGELARHLGSIVEPLLVADLPVVLWWIGGVPDAADELLRLCDRLIVRSRELSAEYVDQLARLAAGAKPKIVLGDLTWDALAPWRDLLSQLFDPPQARTYLSRVTHARLRYATGGRPWEAMLLLGWLASRLGWTRVEGAIGQDGRGPALAFRSAEGPVTVVLEPVAPAEGQPLGGLTAVKLESRSPEGSASFEIARDEDGRCAAQRSVLPSGGKVDRMVTLSMPTLASLLGRELSLSGRDLVYEASLAIAASMEI